MLLGFLFCSFFCIRTFCIRVFLLSALNHHRMETRDLSEKCRKAQIFSILGYVANVERANVK